jgi:GntR family transcriptional regulator / MocR family aminotransferase
MSKKSGSYELALAYRRPDLSAYQALYEAMRSEILSGRLAPGTRLPATRDLARQYRLSRGTIVNAFDQLRSEGYVEASVGSGTFVSRMLPEQMLQVNPEAAEKPQLRSQREPRISHYARRATLFTCYENRPIRAFRANLPALDLFPTDLWTRITLRCLRRASACHLMSCDPLGYAPLRRSVAEYLGRSRGVRCQPDQVAIVCGVQQAIDITARILLNPGDWVGVEDPGYPGAVMAFQAQGAKIETIQVTQEGIDVLRLPVSRARLIYVTPGHQFPMGTTMSLAGRLQLLEWARQAGMMIFEDDYDSEYRYSGRPIPALQGLDESGSVLYAGSFSKVLFPGLRLGYMVIPSSLQPRFEAAMSLTVRHAPVLEQLILHEFIAEGHFGRHVRRMREVYAERRSLLMRESRAMLSGMLEISGVEAGLQTVGWLAAGINAGSAALRAAQHQVDVTPLSSYSRNPTSRQGLQLGFAALDKKEIRRGVRELATALESLRHSPSAR